VAVFNVAPLMDITELIRSNSVNEGDGFESLLAPDRNNALISNKAIRNSNNVNHQVLFVMYFLIKKIIA